MAKSQKTKAVTPRQFRLNAETMAELDTVAREHGLSSRAESIRFLARKEVKRIREKIQKDA